MPIYEYECKKCEKVHEMIQKFSDPPLEKCPDCGAKVEKIISLSSFALKGSGYYSTDYKRPTKQESKKSDSSSEAAGSESAKPAGCGKSACGHKH